VGSHASARERNSIGAQAKVGDIGRAEGSGYKNAACRRRCEPHCMSCCATAEAAHVVRTLGQQWVRQLRKLVGALVGRCSQSVPGRTPGPDHKRLNPCNQPGIVRDQDAGLDDVGVVVQAHLPQGGRHGLQLCRGGFQCEQRALKLVGPLLRQNGGLIFSAFAIQNDGPAAPHSGRGADPAQREFHQGWDVTAR